MYIYMGKLYEPHCSCSMESSPKGLNSGKCLSLGIALGGGTFPEVNSGLDSG